MTGRPGAVDVFSVLGEANFLCHVQTVNCRSGLDEGPIEEVSVVGDENVRLDVQDVVEELLQEAQLILKNSKIIKLKSCPNCVSCFHIITKSN